MSDSRRSFFRFGKYSWHGFELQEAFILNLRVLASKARARCQESKMEYDHEIDRLLLCNLDVKAWEPLFEAEQRLSYFLTEDEIRAEFPRRIKEAEGIGVQSTKELSELFRVQTAHPPPADIKRKLHALYLALLDDIHYRHIKRMLDRRVRRETGRGLLRIGSVMLLLAVAVLAINLSSSSFHIPMVVTAAVFGMIGAFLSRLIAFNARIEEIDYDSLRNGYSQWATLIRILIGSFNASILLALIAAGILAGPIFPDIEKLVTLQQSPSTEDSGTLMSSFTQLWWRALTNVLSDSQAPLTLRSEEAKLVICSLIAGLSERLLPDNFARIEARMSPRAASKTNTAPRVPAADQGVNPE